MLTSLWAGLRYYGAGLYERADSHHVFLMSGGLAFSLFVCAVPFAIVLLAILGNLFSKPEVVAEIYSLIDQIVPYPSQAAPIKDLLAERLDQVVSVTRTTGIIGFMGLLVAATGLFSSLRTILSSIFQIGNNGSAILGKLWDFVLVLVILIITVIVMIGMPALEAGVELASKVPWVRELTVTGLDKIILNVVSLFSLTVVFSATYWLIPVRKPEWRTVLIAALTASFLWLLAKELFGFYIAHAATLKHLYGIYTFVVISAFWIYYSALILIIGAEVAQLYTERRKNRMYGR